MNKYYFNYKSVLLILTLIFSVHAKGYPVEMRTKDESIKLAMKMIEPKRELLENELIRLFTRNGQTITPRVLPQPIVNENGLFLGMPEKYSQIYSIEENGQTKFYKFSVRKCHQTTIHYCPAYWEYVSSTALLKISLKDKLDEQGHKVGCFVSINTPANNLFSMGVMAIIWNNESNVGSEAEVIHPFYLTYMLQSFESIGCH